VRAGVDVGDKVGFDESNEIPIWSILSFDRSRTWWNEAEGVENLFVVYVKFQRRVSLIDVVKRHVG